MTKGNNGRHLAGADEFKALKLIEANGKLSADGCWVYNAGWSDWKIAQEVGCVEKAVTRRRTAIFGPLRRVSSESSTAAAEIAKINTQIQAQRVDTYDIKKRLEAIEKALNILLSAPNRDSIPREKLEDLRRHFNGVVKVAVPS